MQAHHLLHSHSTPAAQPQHTSHTTPEQARHTLRESKFWQITSQAWPQAVDRPGSALDTVLDGGCQETHLEEHGVLVAQVCNGSLPGDSGLALLSLLDVLSLCESLPQGTCPLEKGPKVGACSTDEALRACTRSNIRRLPPRKWRRSVPTGSTCRGSEHLQQLLDRHARPLQRPAAGCPPVLYDGLRRRLQDLHLKVCRLGTAEPLRCQSKAQAASCLDCKSLHGQQGQQGSCCVHIVLNENVERSTALSAQLARIGSADVRASAELMGGDVSAISTLYSPDLEVPINSR